MLKKLKQLFRRGASAASSPTETAEASSRVFPIHRGPALVHHPISLSEIDPDAVKIIRRLTRFGHTAYLVGGCVRDLLLGRRPKDFDVGTTATPRQVRRLFRNCRIIGRRFRLAHVYFHDGKIIEVATFRARNPDDLAEGSSSSEETPVVHDDNVFGTPEEDALRRDFTINALFYDINQQTVIDHADGLADLRRRLVRTIGDPERRFREDPIRILRAIKFAARLDFEIEPETLRALKRTRNLIPRAAAPRILEEINRFCRGGAARRSFELLRETGVFEIILPEFAEGYEEDPRAWPVLLELLSAMDRRQAEGYEVSTAEILGALVLPLILPRLGWRADGVAREGRGVNVRELADVYLKPFGQRLRAPKKELEHCRQILATLRRFMSADRMSRSARLAVARRASAPRALWLFAALAQHFGGPYQEAAARWRELVAPEPAEPAPAAKRRRRSRPRTRAAVRKGGAAAAPGMPPPWDDSYFFAALPKVPPLDEAEAAGAEETPADQARAEVPAPPAQGDRATRRRRRRRRRSAQRSPQPRAASDRKS